MSYFKYCSESGIQILKNLQLKVTPPNQFNDPFEFSPVVRNPNPKEYAEESIKEILTTPHFFNANKLYFSNAKNFREFQVYVKANQAVLLAKLEASVPKLDIALDVLNTLSGIAGIICFSSDPLHPLMWAHYALSHKGIVVEFDEKDALFHQVTFLKVEYDDARVVYNPDGKDQKQAVELFAKRKSKHWEYEQEYRLLVDLDKTHKQIIGSNAIFLMDIAPRIITSVTLGLRATDAIRKEVLSLVGKAPLTHVQVFQIQTHENEFKLHRTLLK